MAKAPAKARGKSAKSDAAPAALPKIEVQFGREISGELDVVDEREWLVTNGIGGYASGTAAGSLSRRYHGLLIAALQPPVGRTQLVALLEETVHAGGVDYPLATRRWLSRVVDPKGHLLIENFRLEGATPVWTYALADALLEKRVWMKYGENTTYVQYKLVRARSTIEMDLKALVNYRDFHSATHAGDWHMKIEPVENGVMILAFDDARAFYLKSAGAACQAKHEWYRDCYLPEETARGLDDHEDHLFAANFHAKLEPGASFSIVLSTEAKASLDADAERAAVADRETKLLAAWQEEQPKNGAAAETSPSWLNQLVLAADQFIVKRALPDEPNGHSVIAGYHWFADWGRDTMIALPGLTLATGRSRVAKQILLAFSRYVDGGMLPNDFPDVGGKPEYNTVDAGLWFFEAVRQYHAATEDTATLQVLFPVLASMIDAHVQGTRYNIHVDPADALLFAGEAGVQLTWMDAKLGDWVVTPRVGKPVEINALWINALNTMSGFAKLLAKQRDGYDKLAAKAGKNFQKFWNTSRNCCYDVIDVPNPTNGDSNDGTLRPNQIFAVSLPVSPLSDEQQKAVVDICGRHLLTSYGLRSLAPGEPGYKGAYGGGPRERDSVYHQGPVWGWLQGPFALAHFRVYHDAAAALGFLDPLGRQIHSHGLGTLSEIFEGDAPFRPTGCIAQAWTVGEVLRAWSEISAER